jgi:hypothetical protein
MTLHRLVPQKFYTNLLDPKMPSSVDFVVQTDTTGTNVSMRSSMTLVPTSDNLSKMMKIMDLRNSVDRIAPLQKSDDRFFLDSSNSVTAKLDRYVDIINTVAEREKPDGVSSNDWDAYVAG